MDELLVILTSLASTAGAGVAASLLLDHARRLWPRPTARAWRSASPFQRYCYTLLYAPRVTRSTAMALAIVISLLAGSVLARLTGGDPHLVLDAALAALAGQVRHGLQLSATVDLRNG